MKLTYLIYNEKYQVVGPKGFSSTSDLNKGKKIHDQLIEDELAHESMFIDPGMITFEELTEVHSKEFIQYLNSDLSLYFSLSGLEFLVSPSIEELLQYFDPRAYFYTILNGTKVAALVAWEQKAVAVNLGGGFHHAGIIAGRDIYGGYCILADIPVAVHHLRKTDPRAQKILIIDCDMHCDDGNLFTFEDDNDVFTFSIHESQYYRPSLKKSNLDIITGRNPGTKTYLALLKSGLKEVFSLFDPDLVFYIEGVDPYINDLGGGMGISKEGLLRRDLMVFECVRSRHLPLVVTLGGGYGPESWQIHYQFISEILRQGNRNLEV